MDVDASGRLELFRPIGMQPASNSTSTKQTSFFNCVPARISGDHLSFAQMRARSRTPGIERPCGVPNCHSCEKPVRYGGRVQRPLGR